MHTTYTGERVRLRPFNSGEEVYYISCVVHMRANPWWGEMWYAEPGEIRDFKPAGFMDSKGVSVFAVERVDTGELVGFEAAVLKQNWPLIGEVGTFIDKKHQKNGFGVEAKQLCMCYLFENFQLNQVWGITLEHHAPARRGMELSGMKYIGRKRKSHFSQGRFVDMVFYRTWRRDWEVQPIRQLVKRGSQR